MILDALKANPHDENVNVILLRTSPLEHVQLQLLQDRSFVMALLENANEDVWNIFVNLAQHPGIMHSGLFNAKIL